MPFTTGTAGATVKNADDNAGQDIDSTPLTGAQFNCGALARGALGPLGLVGGFPALNTISIAENFVDEVASFTLECEYAGAECLCVGSSRVRQAACGKCGGSSPGPETWLGRPGSRG